MSSSGNVFYDDRVFQSKLKTLLRKTSNNSEVLTSLAIEAQKDIENHFQNGEGRKGKKWKPSQRAIEQGGKTLIDTGALSMIKFNINTAQNYALIGTTVHYGRAHNFGAVIPAKTPHLPKKAGKMLHWVSFGKDRFSYGHNIPSFKLPTREWAYISDEGSVRFRQTLDKLYSKYIARSGFKLFRGV